MIQTATKWHFVTNEKLVFGGYMTASSTFRCKINGQPTNTTLEYDGEVSEDCLKDVYYADNFGKILLWNTNKGTYRLIAGIDTALNIITTDISTDNWENDDDIRIQNPTIDCSGIFTCDLSAVIPSEATALFLYVMIKDGTSIANNRLHFHPLEAFVGNKEQKFYPQIVGIPSSFTTIVPCIGQQIGILYANCVDTEIEIRLFGYTEEINVASPTSSRLLSPKGLRIP